MEDRYSLTLRALISMVLLAYGFWGPDPEVGPIVIGLVGGYWLREGEERARRRHARRAVAGTTTTPTDDDGGGGA